MFVFQKPYLWKYRFIYQTVVKVFLGYTTAVPMKVSKPQQKLTRRKIPNLEDPEDPRDTKSQNSLNTKNASNTPNRLKTLTTLKLNPTTPKPSKH